MFQKVKEHNFLPLRFNSRRLSALFCLVFWFFVCFNFKSLPQRSYRAHAWNSDPPGMVSMLPHTLALQIQPTLCQTENIHDKKSLYDLQRLFFFENKGDSKAQPDKSLPPPACLQCSEE